MQIIKKIFHNQIQVCLGRNNIASLKVRGEKPGCPTFNYITLITQNGIRLWFVRFHKIIFLITPFSDLVEGQLVWTLPAGMLSYCCDDDF